MAAALLPLALTLLATASLFGPASVLSRAIRRVVQPAPDAEMPPEDQSGAAKAAGYLCALLLLRALAFVFVSLRVQFPTVFRDQDEIILLDTPISSSQTTDEETTSTNAEAPKVDTVESASISAAEAQVDALDSNADATPATPPPPRPTQGEPALRHTYVDFTIAWEDIWPERQCNAPRKYIYNSYYNAHTLSASLEPIIHSSNPSSHEDVGTDSDNSSDDDADSEIDALDLASRSEDDDLIWAFHSLSISDTSSPDSRPPCFPSPPIPPAGLSPFCPPPPPTPSPPQQSTAWRLEWY
ncbi:hypothetical protein C8F04DRAFT_1125027 [Mycena alexandri]|uniref:Uncharacterized protein n=1 Tax=Mycena alexandri TaxID=1745969 RepID=A0AAD6SI78_9AGAR|nr:hypothetical protein C8F04DRAFT_1125027 [Mycena alexandri]